MPFNLVGTGEAGEWCGKVRRGTAVCNVNAWDHPKLALRGSSCGRVECPICWTTWARRGAERARCRVWGFRKCYPGIVHHPRHIIISPPVGYGPISEGTQETAKRIRDGLIRAAKRSGLWGGSLVVHWYRMNEGIEETRWEDVRHHHPCWRDVVHWSPHGHLAAYGRVDLGRLQPGWVVKVARKLRDEESVAKAVFYHLSHTCLVGGLASLVYFGCCSTHALRRTAVHRLSMDVPCLAEDCPGMLVWLDEETGEPTDQLLIQKRRYEDYETDWKAPG